MALRVGELYAELSLDNTTFLRDLARSEAGLSNLADNAQRAARTIDASGRGAGAGFERAGRDMRQVGDHADEAARRVRRIGDTADTAERGLRGVADGADRAGRATREIDIPSGLNARVSALTDSLSGLAGQAGSSGGAMGAGFMSGFSSKITALGTKSGPIGLALASVVGLGLGAGAVLAGAISDGMQREADLAKVQASLGVDDDAMRAIGQAASRSYTDGWGESAAENASVISEAIKAGLLSTDDDTATMRQTTAELQTLATVMDEDVSAAARAAGQAIKTGLVKDGTEAIDLLVKAEQSGLNVADDMLDTVSEYGTQFRQVGLSGAEAFALMNQAVQNGARDADTAADAIKEFAIKTREDSEATREAYKTLGFDADDMLAKMAAGGETAREGMQELMEAINKVKDPLEKNTVSVGLFGTKAEDLGDALAAMNLENAVEQFGQVEGAAKRAGDTIQNTTAAKIEQAQRSIEESMAGVKVALAEGFGPPLQQAADWVSAHQPEIIGFFTRLADGGLGALSAMLKMGAGTLEALASVQGAVGTVMAPLIGMLGTLQEKVGGFLKYIPGMEGVGNAMVQASEATKWYANQVDHADDQLRGMADALGKGAALTDGLRESIRANGETAVSSAEMFRALGDDVEAIPTEHGIAISENTPAVRDRLAALGLQVRELPDGTFEVFANTEAGQSTIDGFVRANQGKVVTLSVQAHTTIAQSAISNMLARTASNANGSIMAGSFADGGLNRLPPQATIQSPRANLIQWAEPETEGEAFIPLARSKRPRSLAILGTVADMMGMALSAKGAPIRFADGGFNGQAASDFFAAHDGDPYVYGALDCSGVLSAGFNAATGQNVRFTTDSNFAALGWKPGYDPNGFSVGTNGGSGVNGHMAGTLYGTNIESASNGIMWGGNAQGAQDFPEVWHWPGAAGGNPTGTTVGQAGTDGTPATAPGAPAVTGGAQPVFVTNWPGSPVPGTSASEPAADEQATHDLSTAEGRASLFQAVQARFFANGGFGGVGGERHDADIAPAGSWRVWAEPETGGEAYIPLSPAKRSRSLSIWRQTGQKLGAFTSGAAMLAASGFDDKGAFTGEFDTGSTPSLDKALTALAQAITANPTVVIEHAELKADDPQAFLDSLGEQSGVDFPLLQNGI